MSNRGAKLLISYPVIRDMAGSVGHIQYPKLCGSSMKRLRGQLISLGERANTASQTTQVVRWARVNRLGNLARMTGQACW